MTDPQPTEPLQSGEEAIRALKSLYEQVESEIAKHGPVCVLSGRCCRFQEYGHDLFVSRLEAIYWFGTGEPAVSAESWIPGQNCPWQSPSGMCTARQGRPLGCRVYFCDPHFSEVMPDIAEHAISELKRITSKAGMPWDYRPAHHHLRAAESDWRKVHSDSASCESFAATTGEGQHPGHRPFVDGS